MKVDIVHDTCGSQLKGKAWWQETPCRPLQPLALYCDFLPQFRSGHFFHIFWSLRTDKVFVHHQSGG